MQIVNPQNGGLLPAGGPRLGANSSATGVGNGTLPPLPQLKDTLSSPPMDNMGPQLPPFAFGSGDPATTIVNNATNPNVNNVPNNNNGPASRLSTIEESSVATHGNQHQHPTEMQGPGPGPGAGFTPSPPPPPHRPEFFGAPAVPAKSPPSPVAGASARQPLHSSNVPSPLSQYQPQPLQGSTNVVPPRFQNQGHGGLGNSTPGSRASPLPGPPSAQSSRVGSPSKFVPNLSSDQQSGSTVTRSPIGPLGSSDSRLRLLEGTSEFANAVNVTTTFPSKPSLPWPLSTQSPRPQLSTSTSTATTATTMTGTTMSTATPASGGLDTDESNELLKEPGVMYILGEQPPQNREQMFTPGYGAGVGAGAGAGFGSGLGSGVGAGVGGLLGSDFRSGSEQGVANNERDNELDDDSYLYGSNGETPSAHSAVASSNVLVAPSPQTPGSLRAYAGIATESEDSHHQSDGQEKKSATGQQKRPGPVRRGTPMSFAGDNSSVVPAEAAPKLATNTSPLIISKSPGPSVGIPDRLSPSRLGLGRKPSGARELGTPRHSSNLSPAHSHHSAASLSNNIVRTASPVGGDRISTSSRAYTEDGSVMEATVVQASRVMVGASSPSSGQDDGGVGEEALAYLHFADGNERIGHESTTATAVTTPSAILVPPPPEVISSVIEPLKMRYPTVAGSSTPGPGGVSDPGETLPYTESSFAPSNKAAERKAKAKAQKDAQLAAVHKPGRANGKKKSMAGAWDSSEEEDEEEEEDEDEDVDSDGAKRRDSAYKGKGAHQQLHIVPSGSASSSALGHGRPGSQFQPVTGGIGEEPEVLSPSQLRPPRNLPQIPGRRSPGGFPLLFV